MSTPTAPTSNFHNFQDVDWTDFHNSLEGQLNQLDLPKRIVNQEQLDKSCKELMIALQLTIEAKVPKSEICSKSKCWWTKELMQLHCQMNILSRSSYKHRADPGHQVHREHKEASRMYKQMLEHTKHSHWRDWLEQAANPDIWTINKVLVASATDGEKARIPVLKYKQGNKEKTATSNTEKAQALARSFFPDKPANAAVPKDFPYPNTCDANLMIK